MVTATSRSRTPPSAIVVVLALVVLATYATSYGALRVARALVHQSQWVSEEGYNGAHWHAVVPADEVAPGAAGSPRGRILAAIYAPFIRAETAVQALLQP